MIRRSGERGLSAPVEQAFRVLQVGFAVAPIVFGADKFLHLLVNWDKYLSPAIARRLPLNGHAFMQGMGVFEIAVGALVALNPRYGGYAAIAWLGTNVVNLLLIPGYFDIAMRDFWLAFGALALARLSTARRDQRAPWAKS